MSVVELHFPCSLWGRGALVKFLDVASARSARLLAVGLALHFLTACSSIHNQTVAAGGVFVPVPPKAGYATVYIGRPYTFHTSVFALPIHVDDKPLMSLPPGQYTAVELVPGPHSVGSPNEHGPERFRAYRIPRISRSRPARRTICCRSAGAKMPVTRIRWWAPSSCRRELPLGTAPSPFRPPPRALRHRRNSTN